MSGSSRGGARRCGVAHVCLGQPPLHSQVWVTLRGDKSFSSGRHEWTVVVNTTTSAGNIFVGVVMQAAGYTGFIGKVRSGGAWVHLL